jgi:hypothetical protein
MKEKSLLFLESSYLRLEQASADRDELSLNQSQLQILSFVKGYICAVRENTQDISAANHEDKIKFSNNVGVEKRKYTRKEKAFGDYLREDEEPKDKVKKINWRTINKIQELKKAGYTSGQISEELGLTLAAVNKYYAQKTSAHSY